VAGEIRGADHGGVPQRFGWHFLREDGRYVEIVP